MNVSWLWLIAGIVLTVLFFMIFGTIECCGK